MTLIAESKRVQDTRTLAELLITRAALHPDREAIHEPLTDRPPLTYRELLDRVAGFAQRLQELPDDGLGRHVVIALPNSTDYLVAFLACGMSDCIAVTLYPPTVVTSRAADAFQGRIDGIVEDCSPVAVVAGKDFYDSYVHGQADSLVHVDPSQGIPSTAAGDLAFPSATATAMLQYTSGSTSTPKGVVLTHSNLFANARGLASACRSEEGSVMVSWLPLYHDMGMIGSALHCLAAGMTFKLMTPSDFVRRPGEWLRLASLHRAEILIAPNFAYDLCVRRGQPRDGETLDLSHLRLTLNGAEPVRPDTIQAFGAAFAPYGYDTAAMAPSYGLAENTVGVSVPQDGRGPRTFQASKSALALGRYVPAVIGHEPSVSLVGCGTDIPGVVTAIVDPDTCRALPDGTVGEIWVAGTSAASGFHGRPEATEAQFGLTLEDRPERWVRTGDLGVRVEGQLCIRGRSKDMLIHNGENHSPADIEAAALSVSPQLGPGAAAFSVDSDRGDEAVLLVEFRGSADALDALRTDIRRTVVEIHGLPLSRVDVVRRGSLPQTTSGKIQRSTARDQWLAGVIAPRDAQEG